MEAKEHQPHCTGVFAKDTKNCTCDKQQSNAQSSREKLIEELNKHWPWIEKVHKEDISDWILKDRERICEPLVNIKQRPIANRYEWNSSITGSAINETLQRAGIDV